MPKIGDTRTDKAKKLYERLEDGPSFSDPTMFGGDPLTVEEATRQYRQWVRSWILDEVSYLVPELKHIRKG